MGVPHCESVLSFLFLLNEENAAVLFAPTSACAWADESSQISLPTCWASLGFLPWGVLLSHPALGAGQKVAG